jgi:hypothetical protein
MVDVGALLRQFGLGEDDRAAWEAAGLGEERFEEWLTDRPRRARARRG